MSKLIDLIYNLKTDKNTRHTYIPIYDQLFKRFQNKNINILEIGIGRSSGSIQLWYEYFKTGNIYGIDIKKKFFTHVNSSGWRYPPQTFPHQDLNAHKRINLYNADAYNIDFINKEFVEKNITFDIIIDDGPHTRKSQIFMAENYSKLLKDDSILIIEDVNPGNITPEDLILSLPSELQKKAKIVDMNGATKFIKRRKKHQAMDNILLIVETINEKYRYGKALEDSAILEQD